MEEGEWDNSLAVFVSFSTVCVCVSMFAWWLVWWLVVGGQGSMVAFLVFIEFSLFSFFFSRNWHIRRHSQTCKHAKMQTFSPKDSETCCVCMYMHMRLSLSFCVCVCLCVCVCVCVNYFGLWHGPVVALPLFLINRIGYFFVLRPFVIAIVLRLFDMYMVLFRSSSVRHRACACYLVQDHIVSIRVVRLVCVCVCVCVCRVNV